MPKETKAATIKRLTRERNALLRAAKWARTRPHHPECRSQRNKASRYDMALRGAKPNTCDCYISDLEKAVALVNKGKANA